MLHHLLAHSNEELARVDPLEMNLLVAKGVPSLSHLDVRGYQRVADQWADDVNHRLTAAEIEFHQTPQDWKNDIHLFRLGFLCWYIDQVLDIRYREDQRELKSVLYTDPSDLFLNGVIDTRRGTCGNMATLQVALGWRLGWPVSLACVGSHCICRYDDGEVTHNIETTDMGRGGFSSRTDAQYCSEYDVPEKAIRCGSDLRAVTPREMLGLFVGLRARHFDNTGRFAEAERDYLLARYLFPQNRHLYNAQVETSIQNSVELFEPFEKGHPRDLAEWLQHFSRLPTGGSVSSPRPLEETSNATIDACFL